MTTEGRTPQWERSTVSDDRLLELAAFFEKTSIFTCDPDTAKSLRELIRARAALSAAEGKGK